MTKVFSADNKPTKSTYNAIRVLAMSMVLAVHILNETEQFMESYNTTWYLNNILTCFFMISNPLFFMLSGKFNLRYKFHTLKDYFIFYYKKFVSICIPLFIFSIVSYMFKTPISEFSIKMFIKGFMNNEIEGVYWFVYTLISILFLSPFFTKMVENMTILDKKVFFWVLIVCNSMITLFQFIGENRFFDYSTFGIINWHIYYFIGYLLEDIMDTAKKQNFIILLGGLGFVVHFLLARFCENPPINIYDPSPWMIFESMALFLVVRRVDFNKLKISKIMDEIAGLSFVFYLLHMMVIKIVKDFFPLYISATITWISAVGIFIVSFLVLAALSYMFTRFLIKPMNTALTKFISNK